MLPGANYTMCWSGKTRKGGFLIQKSLKIVNMVTGGDSAQRRLYGTAQGTWQGSVLCCLCVGLQIHAEIVNLSVF